MKRNIVGFLLLAIFAFGMLYTYQTLLVGKAGEYRQLEKDLVFQQEKLISAQILSSKLNHVSSLIEENLATSSRDSLASDASQPFLKLMNDNLNELGCEVVLMETHPRDRVVKGYIRTPYSVEFRGNYQQFGEFLNLMEQSARLVTMEYFKVDNNLTQLNFARTFEDLKVHDFRVKLSTLTLVRTDSPGESK
jgi:Tfp pilus assembly protein PilO